MSRTAKTIAKIWSEKSWRCCPSDIKRFSIFIGMLVETDHTYQINDHFRIHTAGRNIFLKGNYEHWKRFDLDTYLIYQVISITPCTIKCNLVSRIRVFHNGLRVFGSFRQLVIKPPEATNRWSRSPYTKTFKPLYHTKEQNRIESLILFLKPFEHLQDITGRVKVRFNKDTEKVTGTPHLTKILQTRSERQPSTKINLDSCFK